MKIEKILEDEKERIVENRHPSETRSGNTSVSGYDSKMNLDETGPDYATSAIQAANDIDATLTKAWTDSKNNAEETKEHAAVVIKRGDKYVTSEVKEYNEGNSSPKVKKKNLEEGDVVAGDFHTHPYGTEEIARTSGSYNWDGQGTGPSGADFVSVAQAKIENGYFMIIESGTVRSIIVIDDVAKYKNAFVHHNGPVTTTEEATIDGAVKDAVLNPDYAEKNPNATNPKTYDEAYWIGTINGLNQVKKNAGGGDIGLKLLRSKKDKKSEYETVFP